LWSYKEGSDAVEAKRDDTIEPPSETTMAARKARQEASAQQVLANPEEGKKEEEAEAEVEDDSWMNDGATSAGVEGSKARKRKGNKKK